MILVSVLLVGDICDLEIKVTYYGDQEMRLLSMAINP
jgi:hypothetical protein